MDARLREGGGDVERDDPRVSTRAAQRVPPQHPGRGQVARVGEVPLHLRDRVVAQEALADATDA